MGRYIVVSVTFGAVGFLVLGGGTLAVGLIEFFSERIDRPRVESIFPILIAACFILQGVARLAFSEQAHGRDVLMRVSIIPAAIVIILGAWWLKYGKRR
jgi:hypothetical protein